MSSFRHVFNRTSFLSSLIPVRFKTAKAIPARIDYKLRLAMMDEDDPRHRSRLVDSRIEADHVIRKADDFSKDDRITVPDKVDITTINGVPEEHQSSRRVRIHIPAKSVTQSGSNSSRLWRIEFDNRERWENPLMGWASTGDPLSNMTVEFETSQDAEDYCRRQGWPCYVDNPNMSKMHIKTYGANFSWNKRTRIGSK